MPITAAQVQHRFCRLKLLVKSGFHRPQQPHLALQAAHRAAQVADVVAHDVAAEAAVVAPDPGMCVQSVVGVESLKP